MTQPDIASATVYLLWHISHLNRDPVVHRDADGELLIEEDIGDDAKLLGCYSSLERAEARIAAAVAWPGFREEPDCFDISRMVVDHDYWEEGFVTIVYG